MPEKLEQEPKPEEPAQEQVPEQVPEQELEEELERASEVYPLSEKLEQELKPEDQAPEWEQVQEQDWAIMEIIRQVGAMGRRGATNPRAICLLCVRIKVALEVMG